MRPRPGLLPVLSLTIAAAPAGPAAIGQYGRWGAFRDVAPARCFAIAEPVGGRPGRRRPFATIATWPGTGAGGRGQVHFRLSRAAGPGGAVMAIGAHRWPLRVRGAEAWAPDPRADLMTIAAMRGRGWMTVRARDAAGRAFRDLYPLAGAASAIDAATVACIRPA